MSWTAFDDDFGAESLEGEVVFECHRTEGLDEVFL
jgi:hypothetical protein